MDDRSVASGQWKVKAGKESEFIERWTAWLKWTSENLPGFRSATLMRSQEDRTRFTSVSDWDDDASRTAWKNSPGFREKLPSVVALCDEFFGGDFEVAVDVSAPALRG